MSSLPVQGQKYTVVKGDTLLKIAARAYGNEMKWSKIYRANSTTLRSKNADLIYPGEVLYIPFEEEIAAAKASAKATRFAGRRKGTFNLVIGDREIPVDGGRFSWGIDLLAFSWNGTMAWIPGEDPALDKLIRRYSFAPAELYLGPTLVATGKLYRTRPNVQKSGVTKELECFSTTADLIDSTMAPPYEFGAIHLRNLANELCGGLGYPVVFDTSPGAPFDVVTATSTEKVGAFLQRLASQRGRMCSTDEQSRVVFLQAITSGKPVANFEEGKPPLESFSADFDGRKRFGTYRAIGSSGSGGEVLSVAKDPGVPGARQFTFSASDVDMANVKNSAEWRRAKAFADAMTIPLPATDWYDDNGDLWRYNRIVTVKSPALDLPKATPLVIRSVDFAISKTARSATLNVCPPWALAGGDIPEEWK